MSAGTWTVAEAKAKFSEVVDKARGSGPQIITKAKVDLGATTALYEVGTATDGDNRVQREQLPAYVGRRGRHDAGPVQGDAEGHQARVF